MFVHLTSSRLETLFTEICGTLGRMESLYLIIDHLLEGVEELDSCKKEAILVLNSVLLGRKGNMHS